VATRPCHPVLRMRITIGCVVYTLITRSVYTLVNVHRYYNRRCHARRLLTSIDGAISSQILRAQTKQTYEYNTAMSCAIRHSTEDRAAGTSAETIPDLKIQFYKADVADERALRTLLGVRILEDMVTPGSPTISPLLGCWVTGNKVRV
jgi:hypothetical protein